MAQNNLKLLLIGGSAGSLEVLMQLLPKLPNPLKFSIVIVVHRKSGDDTILEELIELKTKVPVMETEDKTPLVQGSIYVAPSDYHLLFEQDHSISLDNSEKINFSRPSIDVTFEAAASVFGNEVAALLLSGANTDGTNGLKVIKNFGGTTLVQHPESAEMPFMPKNAIANAAPDYILNVKEIIQFIEELNR